VLVVLWLGCAGGEPPRAALRVGTSGDYAPFSQRGPAGRSGFDVEVARAYARARGLRLRWVPLRWATLDRDFAAGRFDVVMSGVTVRPERSLAGRFSVPVARSGLVLLRPAQALRTDGRPVFAVNAGGHLERAARRLFPHAELRPLAPNAAVREALLAGAVDAAVSDTLEAPGWLAGTSGYQATGPYTRDWKAYWLPAGAVERARDLDAWLLAREADGTLAALRARTLPGGTHEASAAPLTALGAALEERLALMPLVAEAKRACGEPVRVPEQERAVLDAALRSVREAATRAARPTPSSAAVGVFFGALIDGAREVQERTLAGPPSAAATPDLDGVLRPALARVSERIARLLVELPESPDRAQLDAALAPLDKLGVAPETRARLGEALAAISRPRAGAAPRPRRPCRSRSSRGRAGCWSRRGRRAAPPAPG
jgi:cyclohexadienyl dehydratase